MRKPFQGAYGAAEKPDISDVDFNLHRALGSIESRSLHSLFYLACLGTVQYSTVKFSARENCGQENWSMNAFGNWLLQLYDDMQVRRGGTRKGTESVGWRLGVKNSSPVAAAAGGITTSWGASDTNSRVPTTAGFVGVIPIHCMYSQQTKSSPPHPLGNTEVSFPAPYLLMSWMKHPCAAGGKCRSD